MLTIKQSIRATRDDACAIHHPQTTPNGGGDPLDALR